MAVCGQYSEGEQIYFFPPPPRGILFSFMKPCTQVITQYYDDRSGGVGGEERVVFNNLLREKKNVSEVGGSNCQQPVVGNAQMETGRPGWQECCNLGVNTSSK